MVGGASSALISRRLRTAQPGALRKHGIDPSSISVGCAVAVGRHSRIFSVHAVNRIANREAGALPPFARLGHFEARIVLLTGVGNGKSPSPQAKGHRSWWLTATRH